MKFWIGLGIALIAGLLGIGISRELITSKLQFISANHLDWVLIVILIIGLLISALDYSEQSKTLNKIKDEQRGRVLTLEQKEFLKATLINLPKKRVYVMGVQGNPESIRFANTLKDVLVDSDWEVDGVWEDILIGGTGSGILVRQGPSSTDSLGQFINEALNKIEITSRLIIKPDLNPHQLEIIVGTRP